MIRRHTAGALRLAGATVLAAVLAASAPGSAGAVGGVEEFYGQVAGGKTVTCGIYDGYLGQHEAFCEYSSRHGQRKATLQSDGAVLLSRFHSAASDRCGLGNAGTNARTYAPGKTVEVGHFACSVVRAGVRCTVKATGEGFLLGPKRLRGVGGAPVRHR